MISPQASLISSWNQGIREFNEGRFWHAHEEWERGWKTLPEPEKTYLQALIQASGSFYLILEKQRISAALSLARSSLEKLQHTQPLLEPNHPHVVIPNLEAFLQVLIKNLNLSDPRDLQSFVTYWKMKISELKAELRLTRPM